VLKKALDTPNIVRDGRVVGISDMCLFADCSWITGNLETDIRRAEIMRFWHMVFERLDSVCKSVTCRCGSQHLFDTEEIASVASGSCVFS